MDNRIQLVHGPQVPDEAFEQLKRIREEADRLSGACPQLTNSKGQRTADGIARMEYAYQLRGHE